MRRRPHPGQKLIRAAGHTAAEGLSELLSLTMASAEEQQALCSFSRSYCLISQTSGVVQGARLGGMKKEDTSGEKKAAVNST